MLYTIVWILHVAGIRSNKLENPVAAQVDPKQAVTYVLGTFRSFLTQKGSICETIYPGRLCNRHLAPFIASPTSTENVLTTGWVVRSRSARRRILLLLMQTAGIQCIDFRLWWF